MYGLLLILWTGVRLLPATQTENVEALAQHAVEAERHGDFPSAISSFQALLRNGADSPQLRANLGIAYFQIHDFHNALHHLQIALAKSPESGPANLFCGLSLLNLQRAKEALPYLERAHSVLPKDTTALAGLARADVACNRFSKSRELYQQTVRIDPQNAEAWYGLGIVDRILAEQALKQPRQSGESIQSANQLRSLLRDSEQAIGRALQLDPQSVHARMILGESFRIAERYDLAVQEYKKATAERPNLASAWAGLAAAYSASGDDQNALQAAARALTLEPRDAGTNTLIAGTYLRVSDYAKAEPYALRALQLQPDLPSAKVVLAKIYLSQQQPQKALPELQAAAKDDADGATYYLLATTLKQLGKPVDAAAAMRKYKQLHSAHVASVSRP